MVSRNSRIAWFVFPPAALALFFMHLMPLGIYLLIIGAYELSVALCDGLDTREIAKRGVQIGAQALPALAVFFTMSPTSTGDSGALFSEPGTKASAFRDLFSNYLPLLDYKLTFLPLVLLLVAGLITGGVRIDRRMFFALGAMVVAYFAIPHALFSSGGASKRLMLPIAMLLVASTNWKIKQVSVKALLITLVTIIFVARIVVVEHFWRQQDRELTAYRNALKSLPVGARVFPAFEFPPESTVNYLTHVPSFAVIDRSAFVPTMFAYQTQQPMLFSKWATVLLHGEIPPKTWFAQGEAPDWTLVTGTYDYIFLAGSWHLGKALPESLEQLSVTGDIRLFKVVR
jgi:hypothetical protein